MANTELSLQQRIDRLLWRHISSWFPGWFGRRLYGRWFRVRRSAIPERECLRLAKARQFSLTVAEEALQAYEWPASGPTVLLVHGWGGRAGQLSSLAEVLHQAGCRVMAFDARGHGRSPGSATSLMEIVEAIRCCRQYLGEVQATVSHSYGSVCALYAAAQGEPLGTQVMISPTAEPARRVQEFMQYYQIPASVQQDFQRRIRQRFGENWWQRIAPLNTVSHLAGPGLIVHDRRDRIVSVHEAEQLHRAWPESTLLLTRGLGHQRILQAPQVLKAVRDLIL